ncbi:hypothetical protein CAAN1_10S01992 [[Candida] anglica]|uniref:Sm domain-containing protein n=1 Tax=[Candida] anglica TaxID=148631 RepID=A0ABP0EFL7_9ASCO
MSDSGTPPHPSVFIGTTLKVQLKNTRTLDGVLTAIDPFGNLLLGDVWETSKDLLNGSEHKRELGLVSIPKESVHKVLRATKRA